MKKKLGGGDIPSGCGWLCKWVWLCISCHLGVTTTPEGKELGESEPSSPRITDSDYHSLTNAPVSPGRTSIYGMLYAFEVRAEINTKFKVQVA